MVTHRFARAAESGDPAQIAALLAPDVTFHTPVLTQDLHGRDLTLRFLGEATRIIGDLAYTGEVTDGERAFLFWKGIVDDREISGVTVLADEPGGLIGDITVLLRSWGVVANFRDTMLRALADAVPLEAWQLDPGIRVRRGGRPAAGRAAAARARRRVPQPHADQGRVRRAECGRHPQADRGDPGSAYLPGPDHHPEDDHRVLELRHPGPCAAGH